MQSYSSRQRVARGFFGMAAAAAGAEAEEEGGDDGPRVGHVGGRVASLLPLLLLGPLRLVTRPLRG